MAGATEGTGVAGAARAGKEKQQVGGGGCGARGSRRSGHTGSWEGKSSRPWCAAGWPPTISGLNNVTEH